MNVDLESYTFRGKLSSAIPGGFPHGQKANDYGGSNEMKKYKYREFLGKTKNKHGDNY